MGLKLSTFVIDLMILMIIVVMVLREREIS